MGANNIGAMAVELAARLDKNNVKKFSAKSFRRSAVTQLVEAGASIIGLCEVGNWKSVPTAREYVEHSSAAVSSRIDMLDGGKRKADLQDGDFVQSKHMAATALPDTPTSITNATCTVININAASVSGHASVLAATASNVENQKYEESCN